MGGTRYESKTFRIAGICIIADAKPYHATALNLISRVNIYTLISKGNIMDKFENAGIDVDEADPRYENPRIQAAYDWACEWLCDCEAAARICDQCDAYGSTVVSVTADEWYSDDELRENYTCLIGEDVGLSTFIIELL